MLAKVTGPICTFHCCLLRYPDDLHKNLEIQFSAEELDILQKHYLRHIQDISKENSVKVKCYFLNLSFGFELCTRLNMSNMYQVHKDHAFAENPMERDDEEVTVKLEGENMEGLKEVISCACHFH